MEIPIWNFLLLITLLPVCFHSVHGMECYKCNSTLDNDCLEFFNHNLEQNPLRSQGCNMYGAKYCVKVTGIWGGIVGTHRFCSSKDLGNQCQDLRFPDHSRKYRGCIYTCTSDACNGATSVITSPVTIVMIASSWLLGLLLR